MAARGEGSPLLQCCDNTASVATAEVQGQAAKLSNQNKRYYNNITLALSMACWVTIFGLPVYSEYVAWAIFGRKEECGANKMGFKANIGNESDPILVNMNATLIADGYEVYAWCGILPGSYFGSWPSVVQTMIFTVYMSTGSTVKLAWQGLAGTFLAVLNIYVICIFLPMGGADENYSPWMGYLNLFLVLFLFLATKAATNTMMYGMSWTVALMLHFMNPTTGCSLGSYASPIPHVNWDGETTVSMLTALAGCGLAVIATIFPRPMLNIRNVHSDAAEIVKGIDQIFTGAIEYWASDSAGPRRFQVYAKMNQLVAATKRVSTNLEDAYWETFDFGSFGQIRHLYQTFYQAIDRNSDEVILLKAATQCLNFDFTEQTESGTVNVHQMMVRKVKPPLTRLKNSAIKCLEASRKACQDGSISVDEKKEIEGYRMEIKQAQQDVSNEFQVVTMHGKESYCSEAVAPAALFIFAISQWAEESGEFAEKLIDFEAHYSAAGKSTYAIVNFFKMVGNSLASTFDPKAAFNPEQLRYVIINLLPIMITFCGAMYLNGSIFVQYSGTMPGLLTLLVTTDHGIPFIKNAQRLVGIVLGHTMPLLVMSVIAMLDCSSEIRFVVHMISIFGFYFAFTFMYYASDQWSSVGCCIAGFGVYAMFVPCSNHTNMHYASHYKAIAEVIIAMMLKIFFTNVFARAEPRDEALKMLKDLNKSTMAAITAFFSGNTSGELSLEKMRDDIKAKVSALEDLAPMTDPSLALVPGARTAFKFPFLQIVLQQYRLVISDLDMLVLALTTSEHSDYQDEEKVLREMMVTQKAWNIVKGDIMQTLPVTFELVETILGHDTEAPMKADIVESMKNMTNVTTLEGIGEFFSEISVSLKQKTTAISEEHIMKDTRIITQLRRTRLMVIMNALSLVIQHTGVMVSESFNNIGS